MSNSKWREETSRCGHTRSQSTPTTPKRLIDYGRDHFPATSRLPEKVPLQSKLNQKVRNQLSVSNTYAKHPVNRIRKASNAQPAIHSHLNAENKDKCDRYDELNRKLEAFQDSLSLPIADALNAPLPSLGDSLNELNVSLSSEATPAKRNSKPKTAKLTATMNMSDSGGIFKSKPKAPLLRKQPAVPDLRLTGAKANFRFENCNKKAPEETFAENVRLPSVKVSS